MVRIFPGGELDFPLFYVPLQYNYLLWNIQRVVFFNRNKPNRMSEAAELNGS